MHVKLECGFAVQGRHVAVVLLCRCVFADFASSLCVVFCFGSSAQQWQQQHLPLLLLQAGFSVRVVWFVCLSLSLAGNWGWGKKWWEKDDDWEEDEDPPEDPDKSDMSQVDVRYCKKCKHLYSYIRSGGCLNYNCILSDEEGSPNKEGSPFFCVAVALLQSCVS